MIKNKKSKKNERWRLQLLRRIEYNIEGNKLEKIALEENKTLYNHIFKSIGKFQPNEQFFFLFLKKMHINITKHRRELNFQFQVLNLEMKKTI